jgi:hypothetical protein
MTKHVGRNGELKFGANTVAEVRNWAFDDTPDEIEAAAMKDTQKQTFYGLAKVSGTIGLFLDPSDATGQGLVVQGTTVASATITPDGSASLDYIYTFTNMNIGPVSRSADVDGMVEMTFGFTADSYTETQIP